MRITILADLHGFLPEEVPPCDLLILSGDLTGGNWTGASDGTEAKWNAWLCGEFREWLHGLEYKKCVIVGGNHDTVLLKFSNAFDWAWKENATYLCDSGTDFNGVKIWGAPWVKKFDCLAFNLDPVALAKKWALVPSDTDILVCHGPPFMAGDKVQHDHVGDTNLRRRIEEIQPRLVTCGHIHEARGLYRIGETVVINAAIHPQIFVLEPGDVA